MIAVSPRVLCGALLSLLMACAPALAHEGHQHEPAEPALPANADADAADAPRLALSTPRIELVAARERGGVSIYVDDYESNAPLRGLQLQLQSGGRTLQAAEVADGVYRIDAGLLDADKPSSLRFIVRGPDWQENLSGVLPPEQAASLQTPRRYRWLIWLLPVLGLGLWLWRRRRRDTAS